MTLLDDAISELLLTTSSGAGMVKQYGPDPAKWPKGHWTNAISKIRAAQAPGGLVIAPPVGPFTDASGGGTSETGRWLYQSGSISKLHVHDFTKFGIGAMGWWPPSQSWLFSPKVELHDCIVENIGKNPPLYDGQAEACYWIGAPTNASRIVGKNGSWMGMWIGGLARGSEITDFEMLAMPHIGVYIEHAAENIRLSNFRVDSQDNGINCEWWYADSGYAPFMPTDAAPGKAGSHDIVIENFEITTHGPQAWGIYVDAGVYNVTIRNGKISGANGIAVPKVLANPNGKITVDTASIDMTGVTGEKVRWHSSPMG